MSVLGASDMTADPPGRPAPPSRAHRLGVRPRTLPSNAQLGAPSRGWPFTGDGKSLPARSRRAHGEIIHVGEAESLFHHERKNSLLPNGSLLNLPWRPL